MNIISTCCLKLTNYKDKFADLTEKNIHGYYEQTMASAFIKTRLPPELRRVLSCESPAVFLHFPVEEKGPWGPFYQLRRVLAKGRHLLQILLKALCVCPYGPPYVRTTPRSYCILTENSWKSIMLRNINHINPNQLQLKLLIPIKHDPIK